MWFGSYCKYGKKCKFALSLIDSRQNYFLNVQIKVELDQKEIL